MGWSLFARVCALVSVAGLSGCLNESGRIGREGAEIIGTAPDDAAAKRKPRPSPSPSPSATPDASPDPTPSPSLTPKAPTNLTATAVSASRIDLSWTDNSAIESGFQVESSTDGATFVRIATLGANSSFHSATGLAASTSYVFRVRAYDSNASSPWVLASATTLSAPTPSASPSPAPSPSSTPTTIGCPSSGYKRLVQVSTQAQLSSAVSAALPGDQIRMAAGTYSYGGFQISRDGTSADPITLCGPRTAVILNSSGVSGGASNLNADWWVISGITVRNGLFGIHAVNGNHNVIDGVLIENVGQEGITFKGDSGSSYNIVRNSLIRHTGKHAVQWGEGIYIGDGRSGYISPSNYNQVINNSFGPGISVEHIDIKAPCKGTLVQGNAHDATGTRAIADPHYAWAVISNQGGTDSRILKNVIRNVNHDILSGIFVYKSSDIYVQGNEVYGPLMKWGFWITNNLGPVTLTSDNIGTRFIYNP